MEQTTIKDPFPVVFGYLLVCSRKLPQSQKPPERGFLYSRTGCVMSEFEYNNYRDGALEIAQGMTYIDVEKAKDFVTVSIGNGSVEVEIHITIPADLWLQLLRDSLKWYKGEGVSSE